MGAPLFTSVKADLDDIRRALTYVPKLQCVATRGAGLGVIGSALTGGGAPNNYITNVTRIRHKSQGANIAGLRLLYNNFKLHSGDADAPNAVILAAGLELFSPNVVQPVYFGGQLQVTVPAGCPYILSDPIGYSILAADALVPFLVRTGVQVTSGQNWLLATTKGVTSDGSYDGAADLSKVYVVGTPNSTGGASSSAGFQCTAVLGLPDRPMRSVFIIGDSQERGSGDTDLTVESGYVARALVNYSEGAIPYINMSRDGEGASVFTQNYSNRRLIPAQFCSNAICGLSDNDHPAHTAAQALADLKLGWARLRSMGIKKVFQVLPFPRQASSSDSYATAAGQTPVAGYEAGGVYRDPLIALIRAEIGQGLLTDVIDCNQYIEDPANPGKWLTTGVANAPTSDGVHPSSAYHILAAQAVTNIVPQMDYFW